jgi:hypothetical protein
MPAIPALGRLRQEDLELEASLDLHTQSQSYSNIPMFMGIQVLLDLLPQTILELGIIYVCTHGYLALGRLWV